MGQISLGVFEMLNPNNGLPTWTHPDAKGGDWDRVDYWVGVASMLDDAGFDFLFFADTYGYASIDGEVPREVIEHGIQFPGLDPMLLIAALARETRELGFVVTSPTTVEHPYASARRFATWTTSRAAASDGTWSPAARSPPPTGCSGCPTPARPTTGATTARTSSSRSA